jgi:hypothetical protein
MSESLRTHHTLASILTLLLLPTISVADDAKVSVNALVEETQRMSEDPRSLSMVWWIPVEFWEASMASAAIPSTPEQIADFTSILRAYTLFAVANGALEPFGGVTWTPKAELRNSIVLKGSDGTNYMPIGEDQVSPDARNLAAAMKPALANMLGPVGEHTEFVFFPGNSPDGKPIADAKAEGSFRFKIREDVYSWRLPLGSLLPMKVCPKDGEKLSGAWKYCPWHGKKLEKQSD